MRPVPQPSFEGGTALAAERRQSCCHGIGQARALASPMGGGSTRSERPTITPLRQWHRRTHPSLPPLRARSFQRGPSYSLHSCLELGGVVTEEQCRALADYLSPSVGGQYLIPQACSKLLNMGGDDARRGVEEQEDDYRRLKRRPTVIAKESFPPTMC